MELRCATIVVIACGLATTTAGLAMHAQSAIHEIAKEPAQTPEQHGTEGLQRQIKSLRVGDSTLRRMSGFVNDETDSSNPDHWGLMATIGSLRWASVTHSNLCGQGPDGGDHLLRYNNVSVGNGVTVDMIITNDGTTCSSYNPANTGRSGEWGSINLACGSIAQLSISFVDPDTDLPVIMDKFYFAFVDMDQSSDVREAVGLWDYDSYVVSNTTELQTSPLPNGGTRWNSSTVGTAADNPVGAGNMTQVQKDRSVIAEFSNKSLFRTTMGTFSDSGCPATSGRNLLFSLAVISTLESTTTTTTPTTCFDIDLSKATLLRSNLGGFGPSSDGTLDMVISNIGAYEGDVLDLLVSVTSDAYSPSHPENNHLLGGMGWINGRCGSEVSLAFKLVREKDGALVTLPKLCWSFVDIDSGTDGRCIESVTVGGFDGYFLSEDTELTVGAATDGRTTFSASDKGTGYHGTGSDDPQDPDNLPLFARSHTVGFEFTDVSMIAATLSWGSGGFGGRNILFTGATAI